MLAAVDPRQHEGPILTGSHNVPSRLTVVVLALAVLPLSGCNPDEASALAHAAGEDLHLKLNDEQAGSILSDLQHRNPTLSKSDILERFKENAKEANEIIDGIGGRAACSAIEVRLKFGAWPKSDAADAVQEQQRKTSVPLDTLAAVCRAKELAESGF